MADEFELLSLSAPAGNGQENDPEDIYALDSALRRTDSYDPPPEYANEPQRYTTAPMIGALETFQAKNGLKVDGYANPGGPTERAINNRLLDKPRGVGLLYEPLTPIRENVGNGFKNNRDDVVSVQRMLGALGYTPEDPFDRPHGFITESTTNAIKNYQGDKGLIADGWMAHGGETEGALLNSISDLARAKRADWFTFIDRAGRAQAGLSTPLRMQVSPALPSTAPSAIDDTQQKNRDDTPNVVPAFADPDMWDPALRRQRRMGESSGGGLRRPPMLPFPPPQLFESPSSKNQNDGSKQPDYLYVPKPGDNLAIPLIRAHTWDNRGKPITRIATAQLNQEIARICKDILPEASVSIAGGPESPDKIKNYKEYRSDKHERDTSQKAKSGYALNDGSIVIEIGKTLEIWIHNDTFSANADGTPIPREQRHFAKVEANEKDRNRIHVQAPKPPEGYELDPDALKEFAKRLCEQIKKDIDSGLYSKDKEARMVKDIFDRIRRKPTSPEPPPASPEPRPKP